MVRLPRASLSLLVAAALCLPVALHAGQMSQMQPPSSGAQALDNATILQLAKSGLGDDLIIQSINSAPGNYKTGPEDLVTLKQAGLSDRVLGAMIAKEVAETTAASGPNQPAAATALEFEGVNEVGVYYKDPSKETATQWVKLYPEILSFRSAGAIKSIATDGLMKEDRNGHVFGKTAQVSLTRHTAILLYVPDGTVPEEFQLLKLRVTSDSREFRAQTGGFLHTTSVTDREVLPLAATKIAPRMYRFTLPQDLTLGEYGLVPPGSMGGGNATSGGKIYTFTLTD
jgi:hypothetical protein